MLQRGMFQMFLRSAHTSVTKHLSNSKAFSAYPPSDLQVKHDLKSKRFLIQLGTDYAEIQYETINSKTMDLFHTEVPTIFRGKGVAGILAKAAFEYIVENDMKMVLTCEYLQKYFKENETPELKERLVK